MAAGLDILQSDGAAELTVRRVADVAGSSTMGIYTCFGGRAGMLDAVYGRGFELLRDALAAAPTGNTPAPSTERILALARNYREFALANPSLYALMFERPLPDFDPSPRLRAQALEMTFRLLVAEVGAAGEHNLIAMPDPTRAAYLLWTAIHGMVSIELTHALRSPLPGWFLDSPEAGEQVLVEGVASLLAGLEVTGQTP
ncbi:MAG: WHG domain-containing protein [Sporichthyaceae bacterium]|nr:WHG domain-containing protein [Sporichthyaceae bacterium]